jgi:hypothetical protein
VVIMTRAWVVYESMFGNTHQVAQALAEGLRSGGLEVELHEVGLAPTTVSGVDLLVVGAPTHTLGLSRPATREDAARKSEHTVESASLGLREWLETVRFGEPAPAVAAFDTRIDHPRLPGSAAKKADKRLRHQGLRRAAEPVSFWVHGTEGPLLDGELERATALGKDLGSQDTGVRI